MRCKVQAARLGRQGLVCSREEHFSLRATGRGAMGGIHRNSCLLPNCGRLRDELRGEMVSRPVSCSSPRLCLVVTKRLPAPLIPHPHSSPAQEDDSPRCCQSRWSEQDRPSWAEPVVILWLGPGPHHQTGNRQQHPSRGGSEGPPFCWDVDLAASHASSHLVYEGGWEACSFPENPGSGAWGGGCFRGTGWSLSTPCLLYSRKGSRAISHLQSLPHFKRNTINRSASQDVRTKTRGSPCECHG